MRAATKAASKLRSRLGLSLREIIEQNAASFAQTGSSLVATPPRNALVTPSRDAFSESSDFGSSSEAPLANIEEHVSSHKDAGFKPKKPMPSSWIGKHPLLTFIGGVYGLSTVKAVSNATYLKKENKELKKKTEKLEAKLEKALQQRRYR